MSKKPTHSTAFPSIVIKLTPRIDRFVMWLTSKRHTFTETLTNDPTLQMSVIGRKSGQLRKVFLLYVVDPKQPERFVVIATNWGQAHYPAWYYNIQANPQVNCLIKGVEKSYTAEEIEGDLYAYFWELAVKMEPKYAESKASANNRHIPIFLLTPNT